jgi:hypothetical protein
MKINYHRFVRRFVASSFGVSGISHARAPRRGRVWLGAALLCAGLLGMTSVTAHAQIFETNVGNGSIGEYTTSGATVNASLVSGLNGPTDRTVRQWTFYENDGDNAPRSGRNNEQENLASPQARD